MYGFDVLYADPLVTPNSYKGGDKSAPAANALMAQVGGDHYKKYPIQPIEYCIANDLGPLEHGVIKYVTRHPDKGKAEDIRKAIHYLELILHFRYGSKDAALAGAK
jgi:hypothetical protein